MSKYFFPAIASAALVFCTAPASASPMPVTSVVLPGVSASVSAEAQITFGDFQQATLSAPPFTLPINVIAQTFNSGAAASAAGGTDPAIAVSASAGGDVGGDEAQAQASLNYSFEVVGPSGVQVSVDLMSSITGTTISGSGEGAPFAFASTALDISGPLMNELGFGFFDPLSTPPPITVDTVLELVPNDVYSVSMSASAEALCGSQDEFGTTTCNGEIASASGSVDPTFTIDPSQANASQYQIVFSPGLSSSTSAVPEPSTIAVVGFGLLLFGTFRRIRSSR
jgi:hypothetical protein